MKKPLIPRKPTKPTIQKSLLALFRRTGVSSEKLENNQDLLASVIKRHNQSVIEILSAESVEPKLLQKCVELIAVSKKLTVLQKKNTQYVERLKEYEIQMKKYRMNLEVYNAWKLKDDEDRLQNQLVVLGSKLERLKKKKQKILTKRKKPASDERSD